MLVSPRMLAEFIMARCGWDAIWFLAADGDPPAPGARWWYFLRQGACLVGTWTGPDGDLLCVRPCTTSTEAELNLAPPGRTILDATLRSLWRRWTAQSVAPTQGERVAIPTEDLAVRDRVRPA